MSPDFTYIASHVHFQKTRGQHTNITCKNTSLQGSHRIVSVNSNSARAPGYRVLFVEGAEKGLHIFIDLAIRRCWEVQRDIIHRPPKP
jgi:hypothetical protein